MNRPVLHDEELDKLRVLLVDMFYTVDQQLNEAIDALFHRDEQRAAVVRRREKKVDALELEIDQQCELILSIEHPVGADLRELFGIIKANKDLERIGDYSANLAKYTPHLLRLPETFFSRTHVVELSEQIRTLHADVSRAFLAGDAEAARSLLLRDDEIDAVHEKAFNKISELGKLHPEHAPELAYLLHVARSFERIGDHLINIAEFVIFKVEGEDVRHRQAD